MHKITTAKCDTDSKNQRPTIKAMENLRMCQRSLALTTSNHYYYHFVGHCGAFCGLKWRIWRAKMYFSPLK